MKTTSTSFKKGQSGNLAGRPPQTQEEKDLRHSCKNKTSEALTVIVNIMNSGEQEKNRLQAAIYVLERGWGKIKEIPDEPSDKSKELEKFNSLSPQEQKILLDEMAEKAGFVKHDPV